jgi:hypothetical protein
VDTMAYIIVIMRASKPSSKTVEKQLEMRVTRSAFCYPHSNIQPSNEFNKNIKSQLLYHNRLGYSHFSFLFYSLAGDSLQDSASTIFTLICKSLSPLNLFCIVSHSSYLTTNKYYLRWRPHQILPGVQIGPTVYQTAR